MSSLAFAVVGLAVLLVAMVQYFVKVKQSKTPRQPLFLLGGLLLSSVFSVIALAAHPFALNLNTIVVIALTFNNLSTAGMFAYFLATRKTPLGDINVSLGEPLLPFASGEFDSKTLAGQRSLIKFYRGSWCPYCSAELKMLDDMQPKLTQYGIKLIAIANDTSEQQAQHKVRDELTCTLVSDQDLRVIRQYGVEHHKGLGASAQDTLSVFGIAMPLPWKMRFKAMAIPTSLLVDESGKIVWIDQSDDYRIRASEERILAAVSNSFS
ncbi:hypothetical protein DXX93_12990 [Thalassotalea euphylliae]|uniref:Thioredoxin domain-containing protein n=1 Tax=Thalassotalea euphylliae TaxID=1655234 RepID=A0A3E0TRX6_9GAMM|nr:redoxin domain-containing protein [Thalassotalea euphylliae]REL27391.1 hypothetical protein DXX93_12990 [Thalassotalea euphylliae]